MLRERLMGSVAKKLCFSKNNNNKSVEKTRLRKTVNIGPFDIGTILVQHFVIQYWNNIVIYCSISYQYNT